MTDHTRTEKIGGDSINFCGHPSRAENRYDNYHAIYIYISQGHTFIELPIQLHFILLQKELKHINLIT